MKLSVVIPAHNEADCIATTVERLVGALDAHGIDHEIVVVDDNSTDGTAAILAELESRLPSLRHVINSPPHGFGFAVRRGLESFDGDAVAIVMADASDRPEDLVSFYRAMVENDVDCVFGSRFLPGARLHDYPRIKLVMNRAANLFIQALFGLRYNDVTNAFKLYRRHVIEGIQPILSHHFNLTVELPLKSIVRGYSYRVLPNDWINRTTGVSKLKIKEMGSRYLFIVLYCFIERWLSRGDYVRRSAPSPSKSEPVLLVLFLLLVASSASAQIAELGGVINRYVGVTRVDSCGPDVDVDSTIGFEMGDRVLLVQMKGATIDHEIADERFGRLLDVGEAGAYHFGTIESISGLTITLLEPVARPFDVRGSVQLVRVPRYRTARVVEPVLARPWDGRTGGVIALEVIDTLHLDAPIDAGGSAFAGGRMRVQNALPCDVPDRVLDQSSDLGAGRGETIALYDTVRAFGGRGRAATAGGGGNSSNTGGGGGAGAGDGGQGGGQYSGFCAQGTNSGEGGAGLGPLSAVDRLFVGGGGGGGHANDFQGSVGGRGGGIVAVRATHLFGNGQHLSADGATPVMAGIDGSGGGGGGGTVLLEVDSLHAPVRLSARGGNGGSGRGPNGCHGPGGGGGGGFIVLRTPRGLDAATLDVAGGAPGGYTAANLQQCQAAPYGAAPGAPGTVLNVPTVIEGHVGGLFSVAPIYGAPGDRVDVTLIYRGALDSAFRPIRGVTATVEVDPALLFIDSVSTEQISPGLLRMYRPLAADVDTLATYSAVMLLGPENEGTVRIVSVEPDLTIHRTHCAWAARTTNAPLTIELCEAGSLRTVRIGSETALRVIAPNPAQGTTVINFSVSEDGPVRLMLVDVAGRDPIELFAGRLVAGEYSLPSDLAGIASGRYLLRLTTAHESATTPLVVQR